MKPQKKFAAMSHNNIVGALLGLALGDAYGAPYEGGPIERALWSLIGKKRGRRRYTDDTQMTFDVVQSLIANQKIVQQDLAQRFAASYRWSRGYGAGAGKILRLIKAGKPWAQANNAVFAEGSFGNGGAMRSAPVALFFANQSEDELIKALQQVAQITHSHPLGLEGAVLQGQAVALAYQQTPPDAILERLSQIAQTSQFQDRLEQAKRLYQLNQEPSAKQVADTLGNSIAAIDSCVTAIYVALRYHQRSFDELLQFSIALKGDVDTIAAMAGAIWGASRGIQDLPAERLEQLEDNERLDELSRQFAQVIISENNSPG